MRNRIVALVCLHLIFISSTVSAVEAVLNSNPFERPVAKSVGEASRRASTQAASPVMQLRGTMAAGTASLANIGGEILGIGQEINGYRLVAVYPRRVVLEKNDIQKTLSIDNDTETKK